MNDSNELHLDKKLRDVESQLRRLKPRGARLGQNHTATFTRAASRNAIWSHAVTWVSGVAVGCLIMVFLPESTSDSRDSAVVVPVRSPTKSPESNLANRDALKLLEPRAEERAPFSQSMVQRVESIVESKPMRHRLLLGSHLNDALAIAPAPLATTTAPVSDSQRPPLFQSHAKTRQQLMSELLGGQKM